MIRTNIGIDRQRPRAIARKMIRLLTWTWNTTAHPEVDNVTSCLVNYLCRPKTDNQLSTFSKSARRCFGVPGARWWMESCDLCCSLSCDSPRLCCSRFRDALGRVSGEGSFCWRFAWTRTERQVQWARKFMAWGNIHWDKKWAQCDWRPRNEFSGNF